MGLGQGAVADRHTTPGQHRVPVRGASDQLGDQAGLADAGLAPHQDDSRVSICGPPPGRLQSFSSSMRPTKVGLATRPPISPGLSRVTGRSERRP